MAYEVFLPKLGANMTEGKIESWFFNEGDEIKTGDPLFEMITDKAVVDVEAEKNGILKKILTPAGKIIPIVTTVAIIANKNEDISELLVQIKQRAQKQTQIKKIKKEENIKSFVKTRSMKIKASPKARKRAKEAGINIKNITPQEGREIITIEDVDNFISAARSQKKCVIIGAGEYSGVIREILEMNQGLEIAGYIDDNPALLGKKINGLPVFGGSDNLRNLTDKGINYFIVSVGAPIFRSMLFQKALNAGMKPISAIHPDACISKTAAVEEGSVIEAMSVIAIRVYVNRGVFVTQNCSISHDCALDEFSHIAPGSHLGGSVNVGKGALIGVGVSVAPHISIGKNSIITPGSSVDKTVPANVIFEGCPGRIIGKKSKKYQL